jgi:hypothetical protein
MQDKLNVRKSSMTTCRVSRVKSELRLPLAVCVSYQVGDRGKSGEIVRSYVSCGLVEEDLKRVE